MQDLPIVSLLDSITFNNKLAIGAIIFGKFFSLACIALILGGCNLAGYICLGLYAALIGTAVYLCLVEMKRINKQDEDSKQRKECPGITSGVAPRDIIIDDNFIAALRQNGASEDLIQKIIKQNNQIRKKIQKEELNAL